MEVLLPVIISIASILLILLVLMQNPKGGGLSTDFGSPHQLGGVKQTNAFVENATWSLAGIIAVLGIVMTIMYARPTVAPADTNQQNTTQTEQPAQPSGTQGTTQGTTPSPEGQPK